MPPGALGASSRATSARSSCASVGTRTIRARSTTLIWPLSSETTTATASVSSVMPSAARWRVPNRSDRLISVSGRSAAAARMPSPRMITAPSWSSVRGAKIVVSSSCDRSEWSMTPDLGDLLEARLPLEHDQRAVAVARQDGPRPWPPRRRRARSRRCSDGAKSQLDDADPPDPLERRGGARAGTRRRARTGRRPRRPGAAG